MFDWLTVVTSVFGSAATSMIVVYGLSRWLGDVWKARIVENLSQANRKELETLKSELQQSVDKANRLLDVGISKVTLVTRTQFETEFAAYKEIFAELSEVKHCISATRPMMGIGPIDESKEEKLKQLSMRLSELMKAHNKTLTLTDNLSPFYLVEINQALGTCLKASGFEIMEIQIAGEESFTFGWFQQGKKRQEEFMEGYDQVVKLIRERIASLGILPG